MAKLTKKQITFLNRLNVPLHKVIDASLLSKTERQELMDDGDYWVSYGYPPCRNEEHKLKLKTKPGHCLECNPARMEFLRRHVSPGFVYVAFSNDMKISKIGITKSITLRESSLNSTAYGGTRDWRILFSVYAPRAGDIESLCHKKLKDVSFLSETQKGGHSQSTYELFNCPAEQAIEVLRSSVA